MLLTCAWETFERVGWDLHGLRNSLTAMHSAMNALAGDDTR